MGLSSRSFCFLAICLYLGGCGRESKSNTPEPQTYEIGGDFTLTDHQGREFALQDHRGEVMLLFFGYTFCPDFCPVTVSKLAKVEDLLQAQGRIHSLFITVDPGRDTSQQLDDYLSHFDLEITGLTGSEEEIRKVVSMYGASFRKGEADGASGYLVDHPTWTYLIDPKGRVRYLFGHEDTPEQMAAVVGKLL